MSTDAVVLLVNPSHSRVQKWFVSDGSSFFSDFYTSEEDLYTWGIVHRFRSLGVPSTYSWTSETAGSDYHHYHDGLPFKLFRRTISMSPRSVEGAARIDGWSERGKETLNPMGVEEKK